MRNQKRTDDEVWKKTVYEGYEVSNLGNIRTNRCRAGNGIIDKYRLKKKSLDRDGYEHVCLCVNGEKFYRRVHRLVAEAFLKNPKNEKFVNHKNGIKNDNNFLNLEWCTASENRKHAYETGLQKGPVGTKNGMCKFTESDLLKIRHLLPVMSDKQIATLMSCNMKTINNIRNRRTHNEY